MKGSGGGGWGLGFYAGRAPVISPGVMSPPGIFAKGPLFWIASNNRDPNIYILPLIFAQSTLILHKTPSDPWEGEAETRR